MIIVAMAESLRWLRVVVCTVGFVACGYPPLAPLGDASTGRGPHVVLDWQIATLLASGPDAGAPDPTIRFAPIVPAPKVRIAPIDGSFDIDQASYSNNDGSIAIPRAYLNTTWRLEYTLADNIPHEVQWAPDDLQGHLTVPVFGRIQRDPVPIGGGYQIKPLNPPAGYTSPRVFTTGLWTEGTASRIGNAVDYDFSSATSLSGAKGRPDPSFGDHALLVDYLTDSNGCRVAVGSAALDSAAIQAGMHTMQTPPWNTSTMAVMSDQVGFTPVGRLTSGLGKLESMFNGALSMQLFGAAASTDMPGLTAMPDESLLVLKVLLPVPVMQTLLQCPYTISLGGLAQPPVQPPMLDPFPRVLHVQLVDSRQVLGVTLNSGMETVIQSGASGFTMAFPAALPTQFTLATPANGMVDLVGGSDQVAVGPAIGVFELAFIPEAATDMPLRADYYDVVLHRIVSGNLTTERIYTVTAPKVRIDGALLMPGADYVFEVRSYKGHPQASHGNFAPVDYPYGAAIVFTRTFKAS